MAIDLTLNVDARQGTAEGKAFSDAMKAALDKVAQAANASAQATKAMGETMSAAYKESVASIQAAIQANSAYALSVRSIDESAQKAGVGLKLLTGVFKDAVASIHAAIDANSAYAQSMRSIGEAAQKAGVGLKPLTGAFKDSVASIQEAIQANSAYAQSVRSIGDAAQQAGVWLKPLTGSFKDSVASIQAAITANSAYAQSIRSWDEAAQKAGVGLKPLTGSFKDAIASIQAAIQANSAYAQSFKSIEQAAQQAARVTSSSVIGGKALGGAGAESVKSIQDAVNAGTALQTSLVSIAAGQRVFAQATKDSTKDTITFRQVLLSLASGLGIGLGLDAIIHQLINLGKSFLDAGVTIQSLRIALESVRGSVIGGALEFENLRGLSEKLGLNLIDTTRSFVGLAAATKGTRLEGEATREVFRAVASAGRVLQLSQDQLSRTFLALSEMAGKGVISMEELRRQLGQALPGALQATARALDISVAKLFALVESGQLTVNELFPAMTKGLDDTFGKALPTALQSAATALGQLNTAWLEFANTAAEAGFLTAVTQIVNVLKVSLDSLSFAINVVANAGEHSKAPLQEMQSGLKTLQAEIDRTQGSIKRLEEGMSTGPTFWQRLMPGTLPEELDKARSKLDQLTDAYQKLQEQIAKAGGGGQSQQEIMNEDIDRLFQRLKTVGEGLDINKLQSQMKILKDTVNLLNEPWSMERQTFLERAGLDEQSVKMFLRQLDEVQAKTKIALTAPFAAADVQRQNTALIAQAQTVVSVTASVQEKRLAMWQADKAGAAAALAADEQTALSYVQTVRDREQVITAFQIRRLDLEKSTGLQEIAIGRDRVNAEAKVQDELLRVKIAALQKEAKQQPPEEARQTLAGIPELEGQRVALRAKTTAQLSALEATQAKTEAGYAQGVTGVRATEEGKQLQLRKQRLDAEAKLELTTLQGQSSIYDAQLALSQANTEAQLLLVQGNVFSELKIKEQGYQAEGRLQALQFKNRADQLENSRQTELRVAEQNAIDFEQLEQQKTQIQTKYNLQRQALDIQQQVAAQTLRNQELQDWRQFVDQVKNITSDFLYDLFSGQIKSIKDLLTSLKNFFFRTLADMIAQAVANPIAIVIKTVVGGITSSIASVVGPALGQLFGSGASALGGGGAGGTGGGLLETGGTALTGIGLAKQLYSFLGIDSLVGWVKSGFGALQDTFLSGVDSLFSTTMSATNQAAANVLEEAATGMTAPGSGSAGIAGAQAGQIAGIAGGLAALGGGIYGALNAANAASKAAFAASAAAGAAAAAAGAYGAVTGAALVTAGGTGWTGIGLIVAAVMAVIGVVLDKVLKPAGPNLSVGRPGGLNIVEQGGQLGISGDAGTQVPRREGITREFARSVQAQMEEGITAAVQSVVQTINAVALNPVALLGPTQEALQEAFRNLHDLNSASAKNMTNDIKEQLRFVNIAIVGGLLEPINKAFDQLRDTGSLQQQIERLPGTTSGLTAIFKNLNQQLDEMAKGENTDVLRQLSGVRNQVENFGNRIAGTAAQVAESIVTQITDQLTDTARTLLDKPLAAQITGFSNLMTQSLQALGALRATQQTLEGAGLQGGGVGTQIDRLVQAVGQNAANISSQIVTGALQGLSADLQKIIVQPVRVQATTVNSLFTDSMAALQALWLEWHRLENAGIDASGVKDQFTRLLTGILDTMSEVLTKAFGSGSFAEFLGVLASIPDAVAALNPVWAQVKQMGQVFGQIVGPIQQVIDTLTTELQTPAERVAVTAQRMDDLRNAIADAGDAADQALPLYAQLSQAIQANAAAQIEAANTVAQEQIDATKKAADEQIKTINAVADAQIQEVNATADAWLKAFTDSVDAQIKEINAAADAWVKAFNDAADAQIQQVNAVADATIQSVNTTADAWVKAYNDAADAQIKQVNAVADANVKAVNAWADAQTKALNDWARTMTDAVNTWAETAQTTAGQLRTVEDTLLAEKSPAAQQIALSEREATLAGVVATGGPGAQEAMSELIKVEQQLLALAKQSDNLKLQKDSLEKLEFLRKILEDQLKAATGQTDPILAQIAIALTQRDYLKQIADIQQAQAAYIQEVQTQQLGAIAAWQEETVKQIEARRDAEIAGFETWRDTTIAAIEQQRKDLITSINLQRDTVIKAIELQLNGTVLAIQQLRDNTVAVVESDRDNTVAAIAQQRDATVLAIETTRDATVSAIEKNRDELVRAIKQEVVQQLLLVQYWLQRLLIVQYQLLTGIQLPQPTPPGAQQGGLIGLASGQHYAGGGLVHAMLEPGEHVYSGPNRAQQGALMAMNEAFPRFGSGGFTVPGSGSGDTVPAMLPPGSFVLNRNASGATGHQGGGPVQGGSSPQQGGNGPPNITLNISNNNFHSKEDGYTVIKLIRDYMRDTYGDSGH